MEEIWQVEFVPNQATPTIEKVWQTEFVPNQTIPIKVDFKGNTGYRLEVASPDVLGGVRPCEKTEEMTQPVGVDANGALWTERIDLSGYAQRSELPTKVSQLENDMGYLTEHQDVIGTSITHSWNGTILSITSASGTSSADLKGSKGDTGIGISDVKQTTTSTADDGNNVITVTLTNGTTSTFAIQNGSKGSTGADGKTPIRGTDYWTDADKAEIKSYVDEAILGGVW